MHIGRWILIVAGFTYVVFGAAFLMSPAHTASNFDVALTTPTAFSNFRSAQGGFQLGFGIFLAWCGVSDGRARCGLVAQALTSGGFALGRLVGLAADGKPKTITYVLLLLEVVGCAVAVFALVRLPHSMTDERRS